VDQRTEQILFQVFDELRSAGKALLVCSHTWGDTLQGYDRLVLLNRSVIADDVPQRVLTWENLCHAYGEGLPPLGEAGAMGTTTAGGFPVANAIEPWGLRSYP